MAQNLCTTTPTPHKPGKKFACDICKKSFTRNSNRVYHLRSQHGIGEPLATWSCPECGQEFTVKSNMTRHRRRHNSATATDGSVAGSNLATQRNSAFTAISKRSPNSGRPATPPNIRLPPFTQPKCASSQLSPSAALAGVKMVAQHLLQSQLHHQQQQHQSAMDTSTMSAPASLSQSCGALASSFHPSTSSIPGSTSTPAASLSCQTASSAASRTSTSIPLLDLQLNLNTHDNSLSLQFAGRDSPRGLFTSSLPLDSQQSFVGSLGLSPPSLRDSGFAIPEPRHRSPSSASSDMLTAALAATMGSTATCKSEPGLFSAQKSDATGDDGTPTDQLRALSLSLTPVMMNLLATASPTTTSNNTAGNTPLRQDASMLVTPPGASAAVNPAWAQLFS